MIFRLLVSAVAVSRLSLLGLVVLPLSAPVWGDDTPARKEAAPELKGQALILMGLPGDKEHEKLFTDTARQWRDWLIGPLGFRPGDVRILSGGAARNGVAQGPATRETIEKEAARLRQSLRPGDRLWVFFLGHANYDGEHAWFHLPGPDLREDEIGKLFAGLPCREQVFWMTTAESGRFVKDLSAKGRIVIAATRSSGEDNEPEFPQRSRRLSRVRWRRWTSTRMASSRCSNSIIGSWPRCGLAMPPTNGYRPSTRNSMTTATASARSGRSCPSRARRSAPATMGFSRSLRSCPTQARRRRKNDRNQRRI